MDANKFKYINECFPIGVFGCHNKGEKRLFINDLSGMSNELLENITDTERSTYRQMFDKCLRAAVEDLKNDVQEALDRVANTHYEFGGVIFRTEEARRIGGACETDMLGVLVTTGNSRYVVAEVKSISVSPLNNVEVTPFIYDFEQGEIFRDEPIQLEGGKLNEIIFNYSFSSNESRGMFFGIEGYGEYQHLRCNRFKDTSCDSCPPCDFIDCTGGCTHVEDIPLPERLKQDIVDEFAVYAVGGSSVEQLTDIDCVCGNVEVVCSMDQFVCENGNRLSDALQYKVAHNILTEKLASFRQNMWAKGNLDFTALLRDEMQQKYLNRLKNIAPKLPLSGDSMCWECEGAGIYTESMV